MNPSDPFTLRFTIASDERLAALVLAYDRICECKSTNLWPETKEAWLPYFDPKALSHFWWPPETELKDWERKYSSTPVPQRFTDPSLDDGWDFMSLFDAFQNGEYTLLPIERTSASEATLNFDPSALPFGGTGCMRALIEAFDHRVTHDWEASDDVTTDETPPEGTAPSATKPKRWWRFW